MAGASAAESCVSQSSAAADPHDPATVGQVSAIGKAIGVGDVVLEETMTDAGGEEAFAPRASIHSASSLGSRYEHLTVEEKEKLRYQLLGKKGPPLCFEVTGQERLKKIYHESRVDRTWPDIVCEIMSCSTLPWVLLLVILHTMWAYAAIDVSPPFQAADWLIQGHFAARYSIELFAGMLTGVVAHQVPILMWLHQIEHKYAFQHPLNSTFVIGTIYAVMDMAWCAVWCLLFAAPHWWAGKPWPGSWVPLIMVEEESAAILIRVFNWVLEQRPSMYAYCPDFYLNFLRFFRTHFTMPAFDMYEGKWEGWSMAMGYGAMVPFWDVLWGSCPFDIKYSVPLPMVDFLVASNDVFCNYIDPRNLKWSATQRVWYSFWLIVNLGAVVITFGTYWAPFGFHGVGDE